MAGRPPEGLTLARDRDLKGRERLPWTRRVLLGVLAAFLMLGLLNVFGQRPVTTTATGPAAELSVHSPERVRGGLYFQARMHVRATHEIRQAKLVLDSGWLEGMTLNTVEPAPAGESSRDGSLALELGRIPAGAEHVVFLQFQVNPTNVGRRSQDVELYDGAQLLASIDRTITVWP